MVWLVRLCGLRKGITIEVTPADRTRLQTIIWDRNSPQKYVWGARIVLLTSRRRRHRGDHACGWQR